MRLLTFCVLYSIFPTITRRNNGALNVIEFSYTYLPIIGGATDDKFIASGAI